MTTVVLGLGSALGYVLHDFFMIKVVRAVAIWTAMCWSLGVGLLILLPLALAIDGLPSGTAQWHAALFALAGGLCEAAALACLFRGLVTGNLSIVTPLASLAGGIVALGAVAAGEALSTPAMIGLPLAVAGGILASIGRAPEAEAETVAGAAPMAAGEAGIVVAAGPQAVAVTGPPERSARRSRGTAGAGWALLSSVLFAVVIYLLNKATALPPVSIAACGRVGTMLVLLPAALLLGGLRLPRPLALRCVLAGGCDASGFVLFTAAITVGPLAVASVVISQGGTMAVLLGYLALRERLSRVQYAGVACACAACTLFALS